MASTATSRLRLDKQATYDNPETWGVRLNSGTIDMVDDAFGGSGVTIDGDVILTVENYTADQARSMFLMLDGAGGFDITVPAVDKLYYVINDCAADVTLTPLSGTGATVRAGTAAWWRCDGTDGFVYDPTLDQMRPPAAALSLNGQKITDMAAGVNPTDGATLSNTLNDFAVPTAELAMNGQKITSLGDGSASTDAATKGQLDTIAGSASSAAASAASAAASLAVINAKFTISTQAPSGGSDGDVWFRIA